MIPSELQEAFDAYERALAEDDVAALDDAFAPGPDTLRGDSSGNVSDGPNCNTAGGATTSTCGTTPPPS